MAALNDTDEPAYGIDPLDIERGRKLLDARDSNAWQIARLALHAVPDFEPGKHDNGALEYFAQEIGWLDRDKTVATLSEYRSAAAYWSAREVKRWPGLSVGAARRLNNHTKAERERILTACMAQHRNGKVTAAAVKAMVAEEAPGDDSSGLNQRTLSSVRREPVPLKPDKEMIASMVTDINDVILYASDIKMLLEAEGELDLGKLEDKADLIDGIWPDLSKLIQRLQYDD